MKYQNISTLIFDFGGVLINLDKKRCMQEFKNLGLTDIEKYLGDFIQSGVFLQLEKGQISTSEFRDGIRALTNQTLTDAQIDNAWNAFLLDIPGKKLDMLLELRKKFRVLLLSNTNPVHITEAEKIFLKHKGLSMSAYFDRCYLSYEMKMAKPDEEIYKELLSREQLSAETCLFLDDGPKNIEEAGKLGIRTYLVKEGDDLSFLLNASTWE